MKPQVGERAFLLGPMIAPPRCTTVIETVFVSLCKQHFERLLLLFTEFKQSGEGSLEKFSGFNGIQTQGLCDTVAEL